MSLLVLTLLVGLWSAILLPGAVRAHRCSSPKNSVDAFRRAMERLSTRAEEAAAAGGAELQDPGPDMPTARRRAVVRRRVVLSVLVGALVVCGAGAAVVGGAFLWLLAADAIALATYIGLLLGLRARADEARRKVLTLPARPPSPPPPSTEAVSLPSAAGEQG